MKIQLKKKRRSSLSQLLEINEVKLIEQVALRPTIYDRSLKSYRKASSRNQCWDEISAIMDVPAEICRRKWRSLRDSFGKHYKMSQRTEAGVANKHRKWIFYDKMTFLIPYMDNVSIELDKMLDELDDISEDSQSNDCERLQINSNIKVPLQNTHSEKNANETDKQNENQNNFSVSVPATDYMQITMENSQQQQQQQQPQQEQIQPNTNNIDNNVGNCSGYAKQQPSCNNRNNSALNMQFGDTNADSYAFVLDSDEKFLLSCAPTLRRLTIKQNALARLKIQKILYEIEFQQENN